MSTESAVGIVMGTVVRVLRQRSTQIRMRIVPQLATFQPSSGRHRHVDVKGAGCHA